MNNIGKYITWGFLLALALSTVCYAKEYDFSNMTVKELEEVKDEIEKEISSNHTPSSDEKSAVKDMLTELVEKEYGEDNVSWAWLDYNYTKDWNFYTLSTHADIKKSDGGKAKYDIYCEVVKDDGKYKTAYVKIGNEELLNKRSSRIKDKRVLKSLGIKGNNESDDKEEDGEPKEASSEVDEAIVISATDLYNQFDNNSIAAEKTYKGKIVQVSGKVNTVDESFWGTPYVRLDADEYGISSVTCNFSKEDKSELESLNTGDMITIRGTCGEMGFADVSIDKCSIVK